MHKAIAPPVAGLIGTWHGQGKGEYPSIENFEYGEEVTFWHTGRPWLGYLQRTWSLDGEAPMHSESGYWRPQREGSLEVVIAHAFGIVEILEGRAEGAVIELSSKSLTSAPSAKEVHAVTRRFEVTETSLTYEVAMAYDAHPLQHHLGASLTKTQ